MQTRTLVNLDRLVETDIVLEAKFESKLITLEDAEVFFHLLRGLMEAAQDELTRNGLEVDIISEVSVVGGSVRGIVKPKASQWDDATKQAAAVILAAIINLIPWAVSGDSGPDDGVSPECAAAVIQVVTETHEKWGSLGKDFKAGLRVKCGDFNVEEKIESSSQPKK